MKSRQFLAVGVTAVTALALTSLSEGTTSATPAAPHVAAKSAGTTNAVRSNLGGGLGRLVAARTGVTALRASSPIDVGATAQFDDQGRVLVALTPQSDADRAVFQQQAVADGLVVHGVDPDHGTIYGWVPLDAVPALAALPDTGTLNQVNKPSLASGSVDDQGVAFQNVVKAHLRGYQGQGITVGVISDSFDTATTDEDGNPLAIHAAQDVASGDLPGPGNPVNPNPVVVIADSPTPGTDEGRAMAQIVHDMAPKAKLCFATADSTDQDFADHIRELADPHGACRATVIVDDIGYFDEPFFGDGPISQAIDDVSAQGVQYLSAAGNAGDRNSWRAPVKLVPAASAVPNTNLDFSDVPADLYDGGLQDMDPGPGVDPAQSYVFGASPAYLNLQWDEPFDPDGTTFGAPFFTGAGEITDADASPTLEFTPTAAQVGQTVRFRIDGVPSGSVDLILTVTKPDGTTIGPIDTITSPESAVTKLDQAGTYTITAEGFEGDTGPFTADVEPVLTPSKVTTDFNVLIFSPAGQFLGAIADANQYSGLPQEFASLGGLGKAQLVISRSGTGPMGATTLAEINYGRAYTDEYNDPFAPGTYGHPMAAGAISVAAEDPFRPFLPEPYTSPGGELPVYFDSDGNRFSHVQHRLTPLITSTDGANTTFFTDDSPLDSDTSPNFFGTSAAAPHAAAIAALVLQKRGGPHSVSPSRMKSLLASSTFKHDLDPMVSKGSAGGLEITARGTQNREGAPYTGSNADPNFFTVTYHGQKPVTSLTLDGGTASPTALGHGIVFDTRPYTGVAPFYDQGFPFTVGSASGGLAKSSVTATFSGAGSGQAKPGQYRVMTLHFKNGLKRGQSFTFGIDRDLAVSGAGDAREGNGADEFGGAVSIPDGRVLSQGMSIVVQFTGGHPASGEFQNRIGSGFSPIDGYGLLDALQAVLGGSDGHGGHEDGGHRH